MKKFFTLIAATLMAVGAMAQDWKITSADPIAAGTTLLDNSYATVKTANGTTKPQEALKGEEKNPTVVAGCEFSYYMQVRVTDLPNATNPTGTLYTAKDPEKGDNENVAIVITAKKNTDVTLYYKLQPNKSINLYNQTAGASETLKQTTDSEDSGWINVTGVTTLKAGNTYTVSIRGGTIQFYGLSFGAEGSAIVMPKGVYANAPASTVDGFNTITYEDGAKLILSGNASKTLDGGNNITIEGFEYKSTKGSNGVECTFQAPAGKYIKTVKIFSYVNKSKEQAAAENYWANITRVIGDATESIDYTADNAQMMASFLNGANPDVNTYDLGGVESFKFTNKGTQTAFVLQIEYGSKGFIGKKEIVLNTPNLITFEEPYEKGSLDGFTAIAGDLKLSFTDTDKSKIEVAATTGNPYFFVEPGTDKPYHQFSHQIKTGGTSGAKNMMTIDVPTGGTLYVYARTGSASATDRPIVLTQNGKEILNHILKEEDKTVYDLGDNKTREVFPCYAAAVEKGKVEVGYPKGNIAIYAIALGEVVTSIQDATIAAPAQVKKQLRNGQIVIETANGTFNAVGAQVK